MATTLVNPRALDPVQALDSITLQAMMNLGLDENPLSLIRHHRDPLVRMILQKLIARHYIPPYLAAIQDADGVPVVVLQRVQSYMLRLLQSDMTGDLEIRKELARKPIMEVEA